MKPLLRKWFGQPAAAERAAEGGWFDGAERGLADLIDAAAPRSIYCVANSEDVDAERILRSLDPGRDALCQYNGCPHARSFAGRGITAVFCFHMTDTSGNIHGIRDGAPAADLSGYAAGSRACFLRVAGDSVFGAEAPLLVPDLAIPGFVVDTGRLRGLFYRPDPGVIASAGFASVLLFQAINLRRSFAGRLAHRIVLCGFSGRYPGGGFPGHDFHFEQAELARLPNVSRLEAQPGAQTGPAATRLHHELKNVFHAGYDSHGSTKARLLFEVARLHLAAGDTAAFLDYVRRSAGLNPGVTQVRWLLRALELIRREGGAGADAGLERLLPELDLIRARFGSGVAGEPAATVASGVQHPQAGYAVATGERPRVLIVNETSKMPYNRWHLGCELVSRHLHDRLRAHGLECVGWANGIAGVNRILDHDPEARFEGVLINGEGTLHDNADRAFEIAAIGQYFKGSGKRVFLINSVWEGNGAPMERLVRDFDLVAVRESFSRSRLARARPDARVVPDLCWLEEAPPAEARDEPCAVLDCVEAGTSAELERVAGAGELPMFVMHRFMDAFHRAVVSGVPAARIPQVLRGPDVGAYPRWLGGRFHGVVLALAAGVPMLSTPSNTAKIEAMFADIGLRDKVLEPEALAAVASREDAVALFHGRWEYAAADWAKVAAYKAVAREEIGRMFDDIAAALA
jgi:hypothetical protein